MLVNIGFETGDALCPQFLEHRYKLACVHLGKPDRHIVEEVAIATLALPERLLHLDLIIDVDGDCKPLYDGSAFIPERFRPAIDPAIDAVRTAHAIFQGIGFARGQGLANRLQQAVGIIGMDEALYGRHQSAFVRLAQLLQIKPEKIGKALVEEGRFAFGGQPPDVNRDHVHDLRELPLSVPQSRHALAQVGQCQLMLPGYSGDDKRRKCRDRQKKL